MTGNFMDTEQENHNILKKLVDNEMAVAEIYRIYAQRYQKKQKFWTNLANEEIQHARLIEKLLKKKDLCISKIEGRFTPEVFNVSFRYLEEKRKQAKEELLSFKETLSIALDIETGLLEREFFTIFKEDSQEFQRTLDTLEASTQKHCNKIRKELTRKKWFFF